MNELFAALSEPFSPEAIDWRVGATNGEKTKGIALAYIQARPVMDRLDEVVGAENWTDTYTPIQDKNGTVGFICTLSLKIGSDWIAKTDGADTSDIEAIKGGISDAFKRAAVKWGVGRYLYDLPDIWVPVEARGRSFVLKETPKLPDWALPKKGLNSKSETPAREIEKGSESSDNFTSTMTIEDACKTTTSKGVAYGKMDIVGLEKMLSAMHTKLAKNELTPEDKAEVERKIKAAQMVHAAKVNKEI